jgi:DNA (cytosine-5)-methyltransferase 1
VELVLSLYPGVDLLGRAFTAAGFCVVLGPDHLLDTSIEDFHVPADRFTGVIGGPPCTEYSDANRRRHTPEGDRLVRHFMRVVDESAAEWFLMESVRNVPDVQLDHYAVQRLDCYDLDFGGRQTRLRHVQFGSLKGDIIRPLRTRNAWPVTPVPTVTTAPCGPGDRHSRRCGKQGFPTLPLRALTPTARRRVIGNGVPFEIGIALANAVRGRSQRDDQDCCCGCGRRLTPWQRHANDACRKRMQRRRQGHTRSITLHDEM